MTARFHAMMPNHADSFSPLDRYVGAVMPGHVSGVTPFLPCVTLSGRLLGLALGIARMSAQSVTLRIDGSSLAVAAGDPPVYATRLTCTEGCGQIAVRLSADAFACLWLPFRPVATRLAHVLLGIDPADGLVLLCGDQFSTEALGVLL